MVEGDPKIIKEVREELERQARAYEVWELGKRLLNDERQRSGREIPQVDSTFGKGETAVKVTISPRLHSEIEFYNQHLDSAALLIEVDKHRFVLLSPKSGNYGRRWPLPESETLEDLEELLIAVEEKLSL